MTFDDKATAPGGITCADFQEQLPSLFATSTDTLNEDPHLHAHLQACENCSALVRDLEYIADAARQLFEPQEPNDNLWAKIQHSMDSDQEIVKPNGHAKP